MLKRRGFGISLALLLAGMAAGCASHPPGLPLPQAGITRAVTEAPAAEAQTREFSVLIYNVAGLPWPIRRNTDRAMQRIGKAFERELAVSPPDVLLLQEAFVPSASRLVFRAGYRNYVLGPHTSDRQNIDMPPPSTAFTRARRLTKGERSGRILNSGLVVATNHRISDSRTEPYGKRSCAGFDCLANKGIVMVRIDLPDVPEPIYILNTHMNSRGASGVGPNRSLYAHQRQARELAAFIARNWPGDGPLIYAGDFNTRNSPDRFDYKDEKLPGDWSHRFCHLKPEICAVKLSWDSDAPWMDTQDLQGFVDGPKVKIAPVAIAAMFDAPVSGSPLSDHDALLVTYRLQW